MQTRFPSCSKMELCQRIVYGFYHATEYIYILGLGIFFYEERECIINVNNDLLPLASHDKMVTYCHNLILISLIYITIFQS